LLDVVSFVVVDVFASLVVGLDVAVVREEVRVTLEDEELDAVAVGPDAFDKPRPDGFLPGASILPVDDRIDLTEAALRLLPSL